ncbi:hypothetical protein [Pontibacter oryzae]|uniref:hypothetical protein n=1 Tax=Pontibacter oryzae TaxID=2304593 RepID=UPI0011C46F20|nr:hypothetical protein [Pontibacter oryzae]
MPELDNKLSRKGWQLQSNNGPTSNKMGKAVWAYQPSESDDGATAWCVLYYNATSASRILYNVYPDKPIHKIRKKFSRRNMLLVSGETMLGEVVPPEAYTDYQDDRYVYRVLTYQQAGYSGIKVFEKADYEKANENGQL